VPAKKASAIKIPKGFLLSNAPGFEQCVASLNFTAFSSLRRVVKDSNYFLQIELLRYFARYLRAQVNEWCCVCLKLAGSSTELASTDFRDESATLAFFVVPVQSRVGLCVVCLQTLQFIADPFPSQVRFGHLISPAPPPFQHALTFVQQLSVLRANSSLEGEFIVHCFPPLHLNISEP
jgi:hypothetical protein